MTGKVKSRAVDWRAGIADWRTGPDSSRYKLGSKPSTVMQRMTEADTLAASISTPGQPHPSANHWCEQTSGQRTDDKFKQNGYSILFQAGWVFVMKFRVNCTLARGIGILFQIRDILNGLPPQIEGPAIPI